MFVVNDILNVNTKLPMMLLCSEGGSKISFDNIIGTITDIEKKTITIISKDLDLKFVSELIKYESEKLGYEPIVPKNNDIQLYKVRVNSETITDFRVADVVSFQTIYIATISTKSSGIMFLVSDRVNDYITHIEYTNIEGIDYPLEQNYEWHIDDFVYSNIDKLILETEGWYPEARNCTCCEGFRYNCQCIKNGNWICICRIEPD